MVLGVSTVVVGLLFCEWDVYDRQQRLRLPGGGYLFAELLLAGAVGVYDPELVSPFVVGDSAAVG